MKFPPLVPQDWGAAVPFCSGLPTSAAAFSSLLEEIYFRERIVTLGVQPSTKSDERSVFQLSTFFAPMMPFRDN
jgi:hypothetical protein